MSSDGDMINSIASLITEDPYHTLGKKYRAAVNENSGVINEIAQPARFFTYTTDDMRKIATIKFNQHGESLLYKLFRRDKNSRFNPEFDEPADGSHLQLDNNLMGMYKDELLTMVTNTPQNYSVDVTLVKMKVNDFFKDELLDKRSSEAFDKMFQFVAFSTGRDTNRDHSMFHSVRGKPSR